VTGKGDITYIGTYLPLLTLMASTLGSNRVDKPMTRNAFHDRASANRPSCVRRMPAQGPGAAIEILKCLGTCWLPNWGSGRAKTGGFTTSP